MNPLLPRSYFECFQQLVHAMNRIADSLDVIESEIMLMNRRLNSRPLDLSKPRFLDENLAGKDESIYK